MLNVIAGLLNGAGAPASTNSYESIATVSVGSGGASSVTFSSIPSTYKHLQIRGILRTNRGLAYDTVNITANSITSYGSHAIEGDGSSAGAYGGGSNTRMDSNGIAGNGGTANVFAAIIIDVFDYADTNKNHTFRYLSGYDLNGSGKISFSSGVPISTAAITSLTFAPQNSSLFQQYSQLALFGVKG